MTPQFVFGHPSPHLLLPPSLWSLVYKAFGGCLTEHGWVIETAPALVEVYTMWSHFALWDFPGPGKTPSIPGLWPSPSQDSLQQMTCVFLEVVGVSMGMEWEGEAITQAPVMRSESVMVQGIMLGL